VFDHRLVCTRIIADFDRECLSRSVPRHKDSSSGPLPESCYLHIQMNIGRRKREVADRNFPIGLQRAACILPLRRQTSALSFELCWLATAVNSCHRLFGIDIPAMAYRNNPPLAARRLAIGLQ
jgi:hypothetical protein